MLLRLAGILSFLLSSLWAQRGTGELRLTVKDGTGAAIPAAIELSNDSTKTRLAIDLPPDGRYVFRNLPFGFYRLTANHAGFTPASELIEVRSESPQVRDIVLGLQPIETTVQVSD